MKPAVRAAVEIARRSGIDSDAPTLLQETNNSVVWLRPHEVIAKVGSHRDSADVLAHEHRVASALAALEAPVAPPVEGTGVETHAETGFTVTLWTRFDGAMDSGSARSVGESLRELHRALAMTDLELPPLQVHVERARGALFRDAAMTALAAQDLAFLREAFEDLRRQVGERRFAEQPLHGEPHEGNRLDTGGGVRWIDFEDACRGPLEWDLVFLPEESVSVFADVDRDLLDLLRTLDAARRATWAYVQARFPEMRAFGEEMLDVVRARWA